MVESFIFRILLICCFYCVPAFRIQSYISSVRQVVFIHEMSTGAVCNNLQKAQMVSVPLSLLSYIGRYTLLLGTR